MLESLGFYVSAAQFSKLWSELGLSNGHISYSEFLERFEDPRRGGPAEQLVKASNHRVNPIRGDDQYMTAEQVEDRLRAKLRTNFEVSNACRTVALGTLHLICCY